ncbi:BglG family transcription antiterminator [Pectinatus cerevisiiphilus]|uniref:BglG family transcriptional antiterminator n=1 Tax=Pectinatus cerevisiiphilus TaxID=86956 RepID=A0A4R3K5X6_9FIRM|nr:transcription antiterminator [Pectinatus cerevisiiphilus]TCS78150.1 BglG family transcriptional antiterminator [Pectinatus cerevisiiphilus]
MENLYNRQKLLLRYLLEANDFKPVKVFAQLLSCSDKTIRNDLIYWKERGITIEGISGKGIRIADIKKDRINDILSKNQEKNGITTTQRRMKILFDLLEGKQVRLSIQSLSDKYFVSKTSIVNDLSMIETQISQYNLKLHKDVKGTVLTGAETDIRKALVDIISQFIQTKETQIRPNYSRINYDTLSELEQHFIKENIQTIEKIIEKTEIFLDYKITEPYYINLVTHVLILIERIRHDKTVYTEFEGNQLKSNGKFYVAAELMTQCIENNFEVTLNEAETFYIFQYLTSAGGISKINDIVDNSDNNVCVQTIAMDIIEISLKIYPLKFSFSKKLYKALLLHLRPMLNRINYKIYIKNPILDQIKVEFPETMILLKLIMLKIQIKYTLTPIREDEIGYLAVYFQNAIEEFINKKRIVIVCSSGIGTSHLLEKRIKKYFPEWEIIDVVSAKQVGEIINDKQVNLIISTVRLSIMTDIPIAYVSALFNENDAQNLRELFVRQFSKAEHVLDHKKIIQEKDINFEIFAEQSKCIAKLSLTPLLQMIVYENNSLDKVEINVSNTTLKKEILNVYLPDKKDLSEDIIKKIYYWILGNR